MTRKLPEAQEGAPILSAAHYRGPLGWLYRLKDRVEALAYRPYAVPALFAVAFAESSVFPIPPDVLLLALCIVLPSRSFYFAAVATLASVLGGLAGYGIGYGLWHEPQTGAYSGLARFFFEHVPGFSEARFEAVQGLYARWSFWVVFTAGFTPIPYKLFTVTAGVFEVPLVPFALASLVGRAARFFLVAALLYRFGPPIRRFIDRHLGWLTIAFTALLLGGFLLLRYVL
ncbi:MAG: DedA family protein [Bacteroidetes bacterium]|nr:DedA family protein [Bacteroidota bacterium]